MQSFIDEAPDGVIYFCLGTNVRSELISVEALTIIISVFSKIPQRVVMKWDTEQIENKTDNILIRKWLPQQDILANANVKLFISHCGLGGITESKYFGVPVLALPMFADQYANSRKIVNEGWAIEMNLKNLLSQDLEESISQLINNET